MPTTLESALLSPSQFSERVLALEPTVAVFDCDGTLWSGDAGSSFMRWSMNSGGSKSGDQGDLNGGSLLPPERTAWLKERYESYGRGEISELAICGEMVQVYAGLPVAELRRAAASFFAEHVEPHIFPDMSELVAELRRRGVEIWAVSSTCDWVIEEGVRRFGIPPERVLAARVACDAGRATDRLLDVPTDTGKVDALRRVGVTAPDVVFGNSVHDAAMLAIARGAFPVNSSPELARLAAERGWPVFFPAQPGFPAQRGA